MTRHTLIVEGPGAEMTLVPIIADTPQQVFRIGREMFPCRRIAAVNHEEEDKGGELWTFLVTLRSPQSLRSQPGREDPTCDLQLPKLFAPDF